MLRDLVKYAAIVVVVVAAYKFFGGNVGNLISGVWGWAVSLFDTVSNWFLSTGIFDWISSQ